MTLFFPPLLTTIRQSARGPGSKGSNNSIMMHPLTVLQWYVLFGGISYSDLSTPTLQPDLSPCDFWLNTYIKSCLRGGKFETRSAVGSALYQCLNSILKEQFKYAFSEWISRLEKCVQVKSTLKVSTSHYCKGKPYFHSAQLLPLLKKCPAPRYVVSTRWNYYMFVCKITNMFCDIIHCLDYIKQLIRLI